LMKDPDEGLSPEGMIETGVRKERIAPLFQAAIEESIKRVKEASRLLKLNDISLYLYGSVATGAAVSPSSDIDFLSIGLPPGTAQHIASTLSSKFKPICRGVEFATANYEDFQGESDAAYGGRVFLRHYCLHLCGPDIVRQDQSFPGDVKAARSFNGDIGNFYHRWCTEAPQTAADQLGRRIARKTLLAIAGLVSIHDHTWTTDRKTSGLRWANLNPQWHPSIEKLIAWSDNTDAAAAEDVTEVLSQNGIIDVVVKDFQTKIGLWP
jgi:uncharacterized protein